MAKPPPDKKPAIDAIDKSRNTGHPLLKNDAQVMDFLRKWREGEEKEEVIIERIEEWKKALNRLASTSDGKYFLMMMVKITGIHAIRDTKNTVKMVEDAGAANFYLKWIRPYLDKSLRNEIEP